MSYGNRLGCTRSASNPAPVRSSRIDSSVKRWMCSSSCSMLQSAPSPRYQGVCRRSTPSGASRAPQRRTSLAGSLTCSSTSNAAMQVKPGSRPRVSSGPRSTGTPKVCFANSTTQPLSSVPVASKPSSCSKRTNAPCPHPISRARPGGRVTSSRRASQKRHRSDRSARARSPDLGKTSGHGILGPVPASVEIPLVVGDLEVLRRGWHREHGSAAFVADSIVAADLLAERPSTPTGAHRSARHVLSALPPTRIPSRGRPCRRRA